MSKTITVSDSNEARLRSIQKAIPKGKFLVAESMDSVVGRLLDLAGVPKEISK
jgi:hypothetical protein